MPLLSSPLSSLAVMRGTSCASLAWDWKSSPVALLSARQLGAQCDAVAPLPLLLVLLLALREVTPPPETGVSVLVVLQVLLALGESRKS